MKPFKFLTIILLFILSVSLINAYSTSDVGNLNVKGWAAINETANFSNIIATDTIIGGTFIGSMDYENLTGITPAITSNYAIQRINFSDNSVITKRFMLTDGDTVTGDYTFDTDTLFVDSSNNRVGIGTSSPNYTLDVSGVLRVNSGTFDAGFIVESSETTARINLIDPTTTQYSAIERKGDNLHLVPNGGNVGIGTTSPIGQLDITGNGKNTLINLLSYNGEYSPSINLGLSTTNNYTIMVDDADSDVLKIFRDGDRISPDFVIDDSGNVGIGTSSPDRNLHVWDGSAGTVTANNAVIVAESNGDTNINLLSPNTDTQSLIFGDEDDNNIGWIKYDHPTNSMNYKIGADGSFTFTESSNTFVTFDGSDGNVGIGTNSPSATLDVNGDIEYSGKRNTPPTTQIVSGGNITYTNEFIYVTGEGGANDVLNCINGGSEGDRLIITQSAGSPDINYTHISGLCSTDARLALEHNTDYISETKYNFLNCIHMSNQWSCHVFDNT